MQVAAANAALNAFTRELLGNHIRTCVAEDIRSGKDERTGLHSLFGSGIRVSEMPVAVNAKDVAEYFGYALIRSLKELV